MTNTPAPVPPVLPFSHDRVIYFTPAYQIGKLFWTCIVFERDDCLLNWRTGERGTDRFTGYLYHDPFDRIGTYWKRESDHPRYDHNDGVYAGLPHGLRKIFESHRMEIEYHLHFETGICQPSLFQEKHNATGSV